jgi:cytochrome c-type biogenesis protein CcmE
VPTRSPARLIVALSVAAALAVFLVYTAVAGNSTPQLKPSQLAGHTGRVNVEGVVTGRITGDPHASGGLRFAVRDIGAGRNAPAVPVVYHGDEPGALFAVGRAVVVSGTFANGRLAGSGIMTKCPSKYTPAASAS